MIPQSFRKVFSSFALPSLMMPVQPGDASVVSEALRVRRSLGELARRGDAILLQTSDGLFVGTAHLETLGVQHLTLRIQASSLADPKAHPLPWTATSSCTAGMVLFAVTGLQWLDSDRVQIPWPAQMTLEHSRRHPRLTLIGSLKGRAEVVRQDGGGRWPVHDLSEEGVGLMILGHHGPDSGYQLPVDLVLDNEALPVARLQVVHHGADRGPQPATTGFRLLGMSSKDREALRSWLAAADARQAVPAD